MCGIIGIVCDDPETSCLQQLCEGLFMLQHRGQEAAGISVAHGSRIDLHKGEGLVSSVLRPESTGQLRGQMGIGHVRYSTAGEGTANEAQPFSLQTLLPLSLAHNGNLVNTAALRHSLSAERQPLTSSDSEALLCCLAEELEACSNAHNSPPPLQQLWKALEGVYQRAQGAFACVVLLPGIGLLGFRDACGVRPLVLGGGGSGGAVAMSSESAAFQAMGLELQRDVKPGEAVLVTLSGTVHTHLCVPSPQWSPCIFEWVYFSRQDSVVEGVSVHGARMEMGTRLAAKIRKQLGQRPHVIMPVPETSRVMAVAAAEALGIPCREGLVRNKYVARTFIQPNQSNRARAVQLKFSTVPQEFADKVVVLVDDSVVRGTTSKKLVQLARQAGAREVHFCSASPPIRHSNVYGIDMPTQRELVAFQRTQEEVAQFIGADSVIFQDLQDMVDSITAINPKLQAFDMSCFDGQYVAGKPTEADQRPTPCKRKRVATSPDSMLSHPIIHAGAGARPMLVETPCVPSSV